MANSDPATVNPPEFSARIDFRHPLLPREGLAFAGFEQVLVARKVEEVLPCIQAVEAATAAGRYAVGYVAYEAAPAFDPAFVTAQGSLPLAVFGLSAQPEARLPLDSGRFRFGDWRAAWDRKQHREASQTILDAIGRGETYQANLTFPLQATFSGSIEACYRQLLLAQDAGYCGMLTGPDFSVLSASPELFFERRGEQLFTRPMKGTRRRGLTLEDDLLIAGELAGSAKDRAENLMIVDLLRNDLGRIAVPGSVRVDGLFDIERYPTVWQMTSTICARIARSTTLADILQALFPCGSVTGAPKISTMRLLSRLETAARGPYCGAFGVLLPGGDCVFNVPIRTLVLSHRNTRASYCVGSGVVADSDPDHEYDECLDKAGILERQPRGGFQLFETLGWNDEEGFVRLDRHLRRLQDSAAYFGFRWDARAIASRLQERAGEWKAPTRVRLTLSRDGSTAVEAEPLEATPEPVILKLAEEPVRSTDRFLYHKTTHRAVYDRERSRLGRAHDALLFNERGEVTETTIANIAFHLDGEWVTPPVRCGLLPGILRATLVESGRLRERVITVAEARKADRIHVLSSLRGELEATWRG